MVRFLTILEIQEGGKMWKGIGFSAEPFLSIEPLSTKEELEYFVDREEEITELSSCLVRDYPFNLLITGKAGIGKTTLVNKTLSNFPTSLRINLSQLEEHQAIMDRIVLEVAKFAKNLGIKEGKRIEEQLVYESRLIKGTAGNLSGGIPFLRGGIKKEKREEGVLRENLISRETLLEELLEKIMNKRGLLIMFLDDADHLPESLQTRILESCESVFVSKRCISIFASRKETGKLFVSDANSVYRARFIDFIELKDVIKRDPRSVEQILRPRFERVALDTYVYPFTTETNRFLSDICDGNIRELLRYASIIIGQAVRQNVPVLLQVEFAMAALASKNYLVGEIDEESYHVLNALKSKSMSASDTEFQTATSLARATLSNICNRLCEDGLLNKTINKKKVFYSVSPKGEHTLNMYETLRR